ncbi:MAG: hypothetical protein WBI00_17440, partial [Thermoanaerobaculia bacterium]
VKDMDGTERDITLTRRSLHADGESFQWRLLEWYGANPSVEAKNLANGITYIRLFNFMTNEGRDQFREVFDRLDLRSTNGDHPGHSLQPGR